MTSELRRVGYLQSVTSAA